MKNDYRCGKGGRLRLSAKRKKRKAANLAEWRKTQSILKSETSELSNATFDNNFEEKLSTALPVTVQQNTNDSKEIELSGRRIVNIANFIKQLQQLNQHVVWGCTLSDMKIISECRKGLNSGIKFKCLMCNLEKTIWTNDVELETSLRINSSAVVGTIGVGMGFSNMEEFFCAMNIPSMSQNTYTAEHDLVSDYWGKCASIEMEQAVECEKKLAIQREDVDADDVPLLTVVVDGTWAKRSYRTNYASLSGAVVKIEAGPFAVIDYSRADLWTVGTLAYEIFGATNPFYSTNSSLKNYDYDEDCLPNLPTKAPPVIQKLVKDILNVNPNQRPSPKFAATVCQVLLRGPPDVSECGSSKDMYQSVVDWMFMMAAETYLETSLKNTEMKTVNAQLRHTFCSRIQYLDVLGAVKYIFDC